ncbi:hypothetical protein [Maribacter halichondriae]|uniref:hypothetical protein n=1 Tax=Maribacter halichondriae TaxID=2980554 RepID=UPI002359ED19|nr:hypothetical protein [Maribacter sp. Hal144]
MKSILIFLFISSIVNITAQTTVEISELMPWDDSSWTGKLMYVNYSDGKEVELRTTMQMKLKGNQVIMETQYTDETDANSKSVIRLKKGGTYFGDEEIIGKRKNKDDTLTIHTMFKGKDDNRQATIYKTYEFGAKNIIITKKVQYDDSEEKLIRNRYSYSRF